MAIEPSREDLQQGWRYALMILARMAAIPVLLGLVVASFYLALPVYAYAPRLGSNARDVLGLLTIFGGISFLAALGMAELKSQLTNLFQVWVAFLGSVFDRSSANAKDSALQMAKSVLPILCLAFVAGLLSSHINPGLAEDDPTGAMVLATDAGDLTISESDLEGVGEALRIEGLHDALDRTMHQVIARFRDSDDGPSALPGVGAGNWKTGNYVASFPVVFEKANREAIAPADTGTAFARGVAYDAERNANLVENLVEALGPCGEADGTRPVWLLVRGSASSAPFKDPDGKLNPQSGEFNVRVANARRRNVEDALRAALREKDLTSRITLAATVDYENPGQLERDRLFVDRPAGVQDDGESKPQDYLTRAAYIHVLSAANCAPD